MTFSVALAGTNIALYRKAEQISTYKEFSADLAVDGNEQSRTRMLNHQDGVFYYSCMHTNEGTNPWLIVDLGQAEELQKVNRSK